MSGLKSTKIKVILKIKKKIGAGWGGGPAGDGHDGYELRISHCENEKKKGLERGGGSVGGQDGCEPRIEVILKIQKNRGEVCSGGGGWLVAGFGWGSSGGSGPFGGGGSG